MLTAAAAITKDFRRSSRTENRNRQDVSRRTSERATRKLGSRDRAQMPCAYTRFSFPCLYIPDRWPIPFCPASSSKRDTFMRLELKNWTQMTVL